MPEFTPLELYATPPCLKLLEEKGQANVSCRPRKGATLVGVAVPWRGVTRLLVTELAALQEKIRASNPATPALVLENTLAQITRLKDLADGVLGAAGLTITEE